MYFTDYDSYLLHDGTNYEAYRKLGCHLCEEDGVPGAYFAVWAPRARKVSVLTARTDWNDIWGEMVPACGGVWHKFVPGVRSGDDYRFAVTGCDGVRRLKSDPYAFWSELRPANASRAFSLEGYEWQDGQYMDNASGTGADARPMSVYEVHLGSWKKDYSLGSDGFMNYRTLADQLSEYVDYMGYTHVELIGICEHPFDGSWGYQVTGFFSPTSRYGTPDDLRYFVDRMHRSGIGVILDWVPAHFPKDEFCLGRFDGSALYEWEDPLRAEYPEWGTYAFDHSKPEVRSFLISSAFYWIKEFHIDALRVDAVAAMFYSSFSRAQWRKNRYGGNENIESMDFLRQLNGAVRDNTCAYLIAEDSSAIPGVTSPVKDGGFGFMFKWNMGWMNDTLSYIGTDPIFRRYDHGKLTHTIDYAFDEYYVLVLSHDEVVHLKRSMLEKFPGNIQDRLGSLKALYAYQYAHPGKKLLFMGQEFAENDEWSESRQLNWALADDMGHRDVMHCVQKLNRIYRQYPCLYSDTKDSRTFEWINRNDSDRNILSFIRRNPWNYNGAIAVVINFSPMFIPGYACGVSVEGMYRRIFSSYDTLPGGGGPDETEIPPLISEKHECDGREFMLKYDLRPFEAVFFEFPVFEDPDAARPCEPEKKKKRTGQNADRHGNKR